MSQKKSGTTSPLSVWQARAIHTITLPSGQRVKIRVPGIATLLEHGDLPDDLIELALLELTAENGATGALAAELAQAGENGKRAEVVERIGRFGSFQRELVRAAVLAVEDAEGTWRDVKLSAADVASDALPEDDLAMVAEIIQRLRAYDAKGVRIGVEPIDRFAAFRETHGCPDENCEGCQKLLDRLSSTDVVSV